MTNQRTCIFGEINTRSEEMNLNPIGQMVWETWHELSQHYTALELDAFIVMPNHLHGIVVLREETGEGGVGATPRGRPKTVRLAGQAQGPAPTLGRAPLGLSDIIHRYKALTTTRYIHGVKAFGWPPFEGKLWQRNYYD